jgi:ABC-type nitrate/sulfonate/bicarbonate transport system substrate-binding protein
MEPVSERSRVLKRTILALAFWLFFGGIGYSAEPQRLTLGYSTLGPAGTGLWMAREIGAFEKHGLNADLILFHPVPCRSGLDWR